jgi:hypothetical protein
MHHARNINARYVRRIDCRPARDFPRSVVIWHYQCARKRCSKTPLGSCGCAYRRVRIHASARGVSSIDEHNRHPSPRGLVDHKASQLVEGPTVQTTALLFTSPCPDANPAQVLKRNAASGAFSNAYDLFGNMVVNVGGKAPFFAGGGEGAAWRPRCPSSEVCA